MGGDANATIIWSDQMGETPYSGKALKPILRQFNPTIDPIAAHPFPDQILQIGAAVDPRDYPLFVGR